jgi:crotonobetainyl-CoA:carnitine CoA-transferase CaiB-like acyl-CoA transferase
MILAELGATVVKIENVELGDPMRKVLPSCFDYLNSNKRLMTLDLKQKKGHDLVLKLATNADVIVEGFRPGVAKKLGINFDTVKKFSKSVVYCSLSGYGQEGPYADVPGHDINYQGLTGLLSISGNPESGPEFPDAFQVADISGSMFAVISILSALMKPQALRAPTYLDVSLTDSLAMWLMPRFMEYVGRGNPSKSEFMGRSAYGVFQTRDGKYLTLGVVEGHFWKRLCDTLGLEDLAAEPTLMDWTARNLQRERILPRLKKAMKENDLDYWLARFREENIPVASVENFDSLMDHPHFRFKRFVLDERFESKSTRFKRYPVDSLVKKQKRRHENAMLGKDTDSILSELGISSQKRRELRQEKVI